MFANGSTATDAGPVLAETASVPVCVRRSDIDSSADATSRADWNRARASFCRHRRTVSASAGGVPGPKTSAAGGSFRSALMTSAGESPWKARSPVSISKRMAP